MKNILIIDDDKALGRSLELQLGMHALSVEACVTGNDGMAALENGRYDALFLDLKLPDLDGLSILQRVKERYPDLAVIIISGRQDMEATIDAIKFGAFDYIRKPLDLDEVLLVLEKVKAQTKADRKSVDRVGEGSEFSSRELIGNTPEMVEILKQIGLLSRSRVPVLITGESGTGKELVARALHRSSCPDKPFVAINCSSIVPTLLESELFGHEKGAFTGADKRKIGKLEAADEGIMFFDEIGDMSQDLQAKLLRVLQEQEFERVGGLESIRFKARAVFATHCNLANMIEEQRFRKDLYYRIAVARIILPPLRERREDVKNIALYLLDRIAHTQQCPVQGISPDAVQKLREYSWPGNVRELENVLTRAVALSPNGTVTVEHIVFEETTEQTQPQTPVQPVTLADAEKEHIQRSLDSHDWNVSATARALEISPTTLRKKITDYNLGR